MCELFRGPVRPECGGSVSTIIGNPEKLSKGGVLAWVCGRAEGLVARDKCPFLTTVVVMKGLASLEQGGSNEKRIFHGSETAVQLLLNLNFSPWPQGCLVFLSHCETLKLAAPFLFLFPWPQSLSPTLLLPEFISFGPCPPSACRGSC